MSAEQTRSTTPQRVITRPAPIWAGGVALVRNRFSDVEWASAWPLVVLFIGYPVWWLLGVASFMPILISLVMLYQLRRRAVIVLPRGSGWLLVFSIWVLLGIFVLYSKAPDSVGDGGPQRLLVYAFTVSRYLACTIALVWLANIDRNKLPFVSVARAISWMFVFCAFGGVLGVLLPNLSFPSLLEAVLPHGISHISFVKSLIHPGLSDVETVLGVPEPRPKAPFPYANTWGSALALSLPFFLVAWFKHGTRTRRIAGGVILLVALIPIVYSLNRGLWACLAVGMIFFVIVLIRRGSFVAAALFMGSLLACALAFMASPLGAMVLDRFAHQHSNERRGQLLLETVHSALIGSPIVGFGSTRDVLGSFASIAGAATPSCPACGVPPLGTQGLLWFVIFAQGLVGAALFLAFFVTVLVWTSRWRTTAETVASCMVGFFLMQLFVYDMLGLPMMMVMFAIAAAARDGRRPSGAYRARLPTLRSVLAPIRAGGILVVGMILGGTFIGVIAVAGQGKSFVASDYLLLQPSPIHLQTVLSDPGDVGSAEPITVDTEAALVVSQETIDQVTSDPAERRRIRSMINVTAIPRTRVLVISMTSENRAELVGLLGKVSDAYLETRSKYLDDRRTQVLKSLRARIVELDSNGVSPGSSERTALDNAISSVALASTTAGELLRQDPPSVIRPDYAKGAASGAGCAILLSMGLLQLREKRWSTQP